MDYMKVWRDKRGQDDTLLAPSLTITMKLIIAILVFIVFLLIAYNVFINP